MSAVCLHCGQQIEHTGASGWHTDHGSAWYCPDAPSHYHEPESSWSDSNWLGRDQ